MTNQNNSQLVAPTLMNKLQKHDTYERSYYLYGKSITSNNNTTTTDYYRLRVWTVDLSGSGTTTEGNGSHTYEETQMTYKFKVNVATGSIPPINYMVNGSSSNYKSSTYQSKIKTISYVKYIDQEAIDSALASWDMSQARNGSIMGWVDSEYNLYIGSNSTIYAPIDFSSAYNGMTALTTIDFTNLDTSKVTNMTQMFYSCSNLTTLDLSNFDTSNVTNMSSMFVRSGLITLDVSNFDTSKVTNMFYMFSNCSSLTTLDVTHFDTSSVTNMGAMFNACSNLTTLDLRSFDTSKVTSMGMMFAGCNKLNPIIVRNDDERTRINTNTGFALDKIKTVDEL